MDLNVRKATLNDATDLKRLWQELAGDQLEKDPYYKEDSAKERDYQVEEYLKTGQCIIYVATSDKNIVGFIEAWMKKRDFEFFVDNYLYITHFYIQPYYRGHMKLFLSLIKKVETWASEHGVKYIVIDILKNNNRTARLAKLLKYNEYRVKFVKTT